MPETIPVHFRVSQDQFEALQSLSKSLKLTSPHKAAQQLVITSLMQGQEGTASAAAELLSIQAEIQHLSLAVSTLISTHNQLVVFASELSILLLSELSEIDTESAANTITQLLEMAFGGNE